MVAAITVIMIIIFSVQMNVCNHNDDDCNVIVNNYIALLWRLVAFRRHHGASIIGSQPAPRWSLREGREGGR